MLRKPYTGIMGTCWIHTLARAPTHTTTSLEVLYVYARFKDIQHTVSYYVNWSFLLHTHTQTSLRETLNKAKWDFTLKEVHTRDHTYKWIDILCSQLHLNSYTITCVCVYVGMNRCYLWLALSEKRICILTRFCSECFLYFKEKIL